MRSHNNVSTSPLERQKRRDDATARQEHHDALSPQERLAVLDLRLGKDRGAKKERSKLKSLIGKNEKKGKK